VVAPIANPAESTAPCFIVSLHRSDITKGTNLELAEETTDCRAWLCMFDQDRITNESCIMEFCVTVKFLRIEARSCALYKYSSYMHEDAIKLHKSIIALSDHFE
jgi:hypothetical protein